MATTAKQGTKPAAPKKATEGKCRCGCGEAVTALYRPGHDARHCSQLRASYEDGKLTRAAALAQVTHSDKLAAKLTRALDLADGRIAAREAAKATKTTEASK